MGYREAFAKLPACIARQYIKLLPDPLSEAPQANNEAEQTTVFRLPHWFMAVEEWELLLRASERTQQPVLRTALPSLPKQHALIFGNSVNLPTTFKVRDVNPKPKSDDAAIRELWFHPTGTISDFKAVL